MPHPHPQSHPLFPPNDEPPQNNKRRIRNKQLLLPPSLEHELLPQFVAVKSLITEPPKILFTLHIMCIS